jgi:hypothetical protein
MDKNKTMELIWLFIEYSRLGANATGTVFARLVKIIW